MYDKKQTFNLCLACKLQKIFLKIFSWIKIITIKIKLSHYKHLFLSSETLEISIAYVFRQKDEITMVRIKSDKGRN